MLKNAMAAVFVSKPVHEDAIFLDPVSGIVNICDLCDGDPQCVKWCPEGVLKYEAV